LGWSCQLQLNSRCRAKNPLFVTAEASFAGFSTKKFDDRSGAATEPGRQTTTSACGRRRESQPAMRVTLLGFKLPYLNTHPLQYQSRFRPALSISWYVLSEF